MTANHDGQPHSAEAERAFLCAAMVASSGTGNRAIVAEMLARVSDVDFFLESNRWVWRAWSATDGGDVVQMLHWLRGAEQLESSGGGQYLSQLSSGAGTALNWSHYHAILVEQRKRRELLSLGITLAQMARGSAEVDVAIDTASSGINRIASDGGKRDTVVVYRDGLGMVLDHAQRAAESAANSEQVDFTWGDAEIDKRIPVIEGQLVGVAATAKTGKTDFVLSGVAESASRGIVCHVVSAEMTREALIARIVAQRTGLSEKNILRGRLTESEFIAFADHIDAAKHWPIFVSNPGSGWQRIVREIEAVQAVHGTTVFVIDFLQRLRYGRHAEDNDALGAMAKEGADLCRDLGMAGIVLSQINRNAANEGRPPEARDVRQSGQIVESLDRLALLHRPNVGKEDMIDFTQLIVGAERFQDEGVLPPLSMLRVDGRYRAMSSRDDEPNTDPWRRQ